MASSGERSEIRNMRGVKKWGMGKRKMGEMKRERKRREVGRRESTSIIGQAVVQGTVEVLARGLPSTAAM